MGKLSETEIEEYFNEHLPYRNQVLLAHKNLCDKGPYDGDQAILRACFEASLVTGRIYLNVLGVRVNKNGCLAKNTFRSDDVSAEDLGGRLVDIQQIPVPDKVLFEGFLKMADKNAHLTLLMNHPGEYTHDVIDLIVSYLKKYLYLPTRHNFTL